MLYVDASDGFLDITDPPGKNNLQNSIVLPHMLKVCLSFAVLYAQLYSSSVYHRVKREPIVTCVRESRSFGQGFCTEGLLSIRRVLWVPCGELKASVKPSGGVLKVFPSLPALGEGEITAEGSPERIRRGAASSRSTM